MVGSARVRPVCQRQGVQLAAHPAAQRLVDHLVLLHPRLAAERSETTCARVVVAVAGQILDRAPAASGRLCLDQALDVVGASSPWLDSPAQLGVGRHVAPAARPRAPLAALPAIWQLAAEQCQRVAAGARRRARAGTPARLRPPQHGAGRSLGDRQQIAALILAEPASRVRWRRPRGTRRASAPVPPAIAISATATSRPPSDRSWQAATRPARDLAAHEIAVAPLGGEIDRRRRAVLAAARSRAGRASWPSQPRRLADQHQRQSRRAPARCRPCASRSSISPSAADHRASAGSRCRRSRCRARRCRDTTGKSSARQASAMPSMQPTNWPMISGCSGLPKFR